MTALSIIIDVVLILIALALIVAVLMQQGQKQGLGAIGGGAETFFGKNKAKSYEAKMAKITKIGAAIFIVAAIAATIVASHITGKDVEPAATEEPTETVEPADAEATEEPAADATDEPVEEATEAPAEEATEAPAEEATEAPAEEATAEPEATPAA